MRKLSWKRFASVKTALLLLAAALALLSAFVSLQALWINHEVKVGHLVPAAAAAASSLSAAPATTVSPTHTAAVSEAPLPINALANYQVPPSAPRVIRIDSLKLAARILPMGINPDNSLQAPQNIHDTGWYNASAKPGEAGAMLVNGHYTGFSGAGVFYHLDALKPGTVISIERGDGKVFKYAVDRVEQFTTNTVPMAQLLVSRSSTAQSLNLITCAGTFQTKANTYDKRLVVYASAIK